MRRADRSASSRERFFWIAAIVATLAIYLSLYWVRAPVEWLRGRGLLQVTVLALFAVTALGIVIVVARRRPGSWEIAALGACGVVYVIALLSVERHEERLHFLEYGVVAGFVFAALSERRRHQGLPKGAAPVAAVVLTGLAGWVDEAIQGVLPNRVYELRDAGLNLVAGVLAVASLELLRAARTADRRR